MTPTTSWNGAWSCVPLGIACAICDAGATDSAALVMPPYRRDVRERRQLSIWMPGAEVRQRVPERVVLLAAWHRLRGICDAVATTTRRPAASTPTFTKRGRRVTHGNDAVVFWKQLGVCAAAMIPVTWQPCRGGAWMCGSALAPGQWSDRTELFVAGCRPRLSCDCALPPTPKTAWTSKRCARDSTASCRVFHRCSRGTTARYRGFRLRNLVSTARDRVLLRRPRDLDERGRLLREQSSERVPAVSDLYAFLFSSCYEPLHGLRWTDDRRRSVGKRRSASPAGAAWVLTVRWQAVERPMMATEEPGALPQKPSDVDVVRPIETANALLCFECRLLVRSTSRAPIAARSCRLPRFPRRPTWPTARRRCWSPRRSGGAFTRPPSLQCCRAQRPSRGAGVRSWWLSASPWSV